MILQKQMNDLGACIRHYFSTPRRAMDRLNLMKTGGAATLCAVVGLTSVSSAVALEVDWSGQFWSEYNFIHNYSMDGSAGGADPDSAKLNQGGYYVPSAGSKDAVFQSLFLRLRPKVVVNDNIYIKSEWWLGDPLFSIFGSSLPYSNDQRQHYSSQSRGTAISAQRVWGEFLTDLGTVQVGRVPLHWGLGIVWNGGDDLWSRYMSSGDAVRWIAKFGSFTFIPSVIVNSAGNNIGGACAVSGGVCTPGGGMGGVVDYSVILKYETVEDVLEGGVNMIRRTGGTAVDANGGVLTPPGGTAGSMNFTTFDFYARKKFDSLTLAAEVPLVTGSVGSSEFISVAAAGELDWKLSDGLELQTKIGYAPGQPNQASTSSIGTYRAFYFNPNYQIGMIMFNYQLSNFGGAQTQNNASLSAASLKSPYDNPIVDAAYLSVATQIKLSDKWTLRPGLVYAVAPTSAAPGEAFYNYWTRSMQNNNAGIAQGRDLGYEVDLGISFQWDEYLKFSWDNGLFVPGNFYTFSNVAGNPNANAPVFATSARIGVSF